MILIGEGWPSNEDHVLKIFPPSHDGKAETSVVRTLFGLMTVTALDITIINAQVRFSFYVKRSPGTAVHSCQCMVYEDEFSREVHLEFNHNSAACRNECCLQALCWRCQQVTFAIDTVEYFTDNMEVGREIDASITYVQAHRFADTGSHVIYKCSRFSVEDDVLRPSVEIGLCVE